MNKKNLLMQCFFWGIFLAFALEYVCAKENEESKSVIGLSLDEQTVSGQGVTGKALPDGSVLRWAWKNYTGSSEWRYVILWTDPSDADRAGKRPTFHRHLSIVKPSSDNQVYALKPDYSVEMIPLSANQVQNVFAFMKRPSDALWEAEVPENVYSGSMKEFWKEKIIPYLSTIPWEGHEIKNSRRGLFPSSKTIEDGSVTLYCVSKYSPRGSEEPLFLILWTRSFVPCPLSVMENVGEIVIDGHSVKPSFEKQVYALRPDYSLEKIPLSDDEAQKILGSVKGKDLPVYSDPVKKSMEAKGIPLAPEEKLWKEKILPRLSSIPMEKADQMEGSSH